MSGENQAERHEYKRLQHSMNSFKEGVLSFAKKLKDHEVQLMRYRQLGEHRKILSEELNASSTIKSMQALVLNVQELRTAVKYPSNCELVEKFLLSVEAEVCDAVNCFQSSLQSLSAINDIPVCVADSNNDALTCKASAETMQADLQSTVNLTDREREAEMCRKLLQDIVDLNDIMKQTATYVQAQSVVVDSIQTHIENAAVNVDQAARDIRWVTNMKAATLPVTGALVGSMIGGPVGLVVGLKAGAVVAVAGCVFGALGGKFFSRSMKSSGVVHNDAHSESDITHLKSS